LPADLANHAAATAEGYVRVQVDYGAGFALRYVSRYERTYDGDAQSGALRQIEGWDSSSQANADQKALDALNGFRRFMFGGDATNTNKGPRSGQTLVPAKN
jgi:hypothetical protein